MGLLYFCCFFQSFFQTTPPPPPTPTEAQFVHCVYPKVTELVESVERIYTRPEEMTSGCMLTFQEQALQAAYLAQQENPESSSLVLAALLHNLTRLIKDESKVVQYIQEIWGEEVSIPISNSMISKQCLAAIDPGYVANLSYAEQENLMKQGGALAQDSSEYIAFRNAPYFTTSLAIRRWNDKTTSCVKHAIDFSSFKPLLVDSAYSHLRLTHTEQEVPKVVALLEECSTLLKCKVKSGSRPHLGRGYCEQCQIDIDQPEVD